MLPTTLSQLTPKRRTGFTLVELLVSLALVIFIMSLLSTLFVLATKTFRDMKSHGDLTEQLRSAAQVIKALVKAPHFIAADGRPVHLSDSDFWDRKKRSFTDIDDDNFDFNWRRGFFRLERVQEYDDQVAALVAANPLRRCGLVSDHRLSMACILPGRLPEDFFTVNFQNRAGLPAELATPNETKYETGNTVRSKYGEVAFYLTKPSGTLSQTGVISESTPSLPLFDLHLKTWLINQYQSNLGVDYSSSFENSLSLSQSGSNWVFNDITMVGTRANRASYKALLGLAPYNVATPPNVYSLAATNRANGPVDDFVLIKNVISFEVKLLSKTSAPGFDSTPTFDSDVYESPVAVFPDQPAVIKPRIVGIKITLRVYDPDNEITRQLTILEPL